MRLPQTLLSITAAAILVGCSPKPDPSLNSGWNTDASALISDSAYGKDDAPIRKPADKKRIDDPTDRPTSANPPTAVRLLAWNVESGGNDPAVIGEQLSHFLGYDVICLSEVEPQNFARYASALQDEYHDIHGNTGRADRLQILVSKARYDILLTKELSQHRGYTLNKGNHRSPLFVQIKNKRSGQELIVMTNHLARGNADFRKEQAIGLREWAREQSVPVIALGDFNMDYNYRSRKGNAAFDEMVRDNVWSWLAPDDFVDTNWSDRDGDGNDNYPDSMLDLAFAAGAAKEWGIECRVIVRPDDFPDDNSTSDHRPIELIYAH
ncbi:MAG: hypothetical protein CMM01_24700 [Rhodopirellula sp.]|nr:hypothetical protein [Rhodopirellula sp.]